MKDKLQRFFSSKNISNTLKRPSKRTRYLIVIALIGLLLLILGKTLSSSPEETSSKYELNNSVNKTAVEESNTEEILIVPSVEELETNYEKELKSLLDKIQGVSEAEVMVNLDSTNVKVYEKNLIVGQQVTDESDKNGGLRKVEDSTEETQVVLVRQGEKEVPLLIQTKKPKVRGVFIVAKGVDHATVKMWVLEAVARVLDVPTHKVSVMPKN